MGVESNIYGALTCDAQYKKLNRALGVVLGVNITPDEYYTILQLMSEIPKTATLVLEETHEDI